MRSKNEIKNELVAIKKRLDQLQGKEIEAQNMVVGKEKADQTTAYLLQLLKLITDENKKTRMILEQLSHRIPDAFDADLPEETVQGDLEQEPTTKIVPISELDAKILQYMQMQHSGMACADDIRRMMSYKGRNAASARLTKLHKQGIVERFQTGHKVYYMYNPNKTRNTLIVSPPQKS